jgi:hypothetical protein
MADHIVGRFILALSRRRRMSVLGHVWTAPWQELSDVSAAFGRVRSCVRPVCAAGVAAGHNALRGSGPNRKHAFKDAMTQAGSPDPRNDLVCITSSCPRQFVKALSSMSSVPLSAVTSPPWIAHRRFNSVLHFDAAEWTPSTAS